CVYFYRHLYLCDLSSFPTRRSSDLDHAGLRGLDRDGHLVGRALDVDASDRGIAEPSADRVADPDVLFQEHRIVLLVREPLRVPRSEEHTSELQSRVDLVCRLLLEKK